MFYYVGIERGAGIVAHHCIPSASQPRVVTTPLLPLRAKFKLLPVNYYIFHKLTVKVSPTQQERGCRAEVERTLNLNQNHGPAQAATHKPHLKKCWGKEEEGEEEGEKGKEEEGEGERKGRY